MDTVTLVIIIVVTTYIVFTIIELIGLYSFNLNFYNRGFKVYEKKLKYRFSNWNDLEDKYSEDEGIFVFLSEMKVGYFISRFFYLRSYNVFAVFSGISLTIFGKIKEDKGDLLITFFISYRVVILTLSIIIGIILITIFSMSLNSMLIGVGAIGVILIFILIVRTFYKGKFYTMIDEIVNILKIRK